MSRLGRPVPARPRRALGARAALTALVVAVLAACASTPSLEVGEIAAVSSDTHEFEMAVVAVTESTAAETGLTEMSGAELEGVPWLVHYRLDVVGADAEDVSMDQRPDLGRDGWTVRTDSGARVGATYVMGSSPECPEVDDGAGAGTVVNACQLFVLAEGQTPSTVVVDGVATWRLDEG